MVAVIDGGKRNLLVSNMLPQHSFRSAEVATKGVL